MRAAFPALCAVAVLGVYFSGTAVAAQSRNANPQEAGVRYCPAPWCDNSEFINTHFGVDAKTGKVTKYSGTVHPDETGDVSGAGEQVLYSAPPPQVANRYVPPANSAAAQPYPSSPAVSRSVPTAAGASRSRPGAATPYTRMNSSPQPRGRQAESGAVQATTVPSANSGQGQKKTQGKLPWWKAIFKK